MNLSGAAIERIARSARKHFDLPVSNLFEVSERLSKTLNDLPEGELNSIQGALQETLTALQIELSDISGQVSSANKEDENKGKQKVTLAQIEESLEAAELISCFDPTKSAAWIEEEKSGERCLYSGLSTWEINCMRTCLRDVLAC